MNDRSNVVAIETADSCMLPVVDADRVESVRRVMPGPETMEDLAQIFGLLSDPGRLRLIAALLEGGEMCVCDLAAATGHSMSAASHALRLLRAHNVVKVRRTGRMAYYRLADSHVRLLFDLAITHITHEEKDRDDE
ncbi:metalloregulator ArsR/SmtB family transcription factor [Microbispora sp. NBC_01189]|uniref:ArsR/SmtB family transcription factor n=1 Tax=Microbispora sp. NBC_01189 TaxID=2903583 RepID=UPI002E161DDC|nr:metalloregulator ArsR/SmtB family transcription factor [Microbispora sp. NBC_01189]